MRYEVFGLLVLISVNVVVRDSPCHCIGAVDVQWFVGMVAHCVLWNAFVS